MALSRTLIGSAIVEGDTSPAYTIPTGSKAVILVTWDADGDTPASPSVGGDAMTALVTSGASPINFPVKIWGLNDPSTGSQEVTYGTSPTYRGVSAMFSYDTNLDFTSPTTDTLNDGGAAPAATMSLTKAAGDEVIAGASLLDIGGGSGAAIVGTSGVAQDDTATVDTLDFAGLGHYDGSATSVTIGWNSAGSTEQYFCQAAVVIKEAAGGGSTESVTGEFVTSTFSTLLDAASLRFNATLEAVTNAFTWAGDASNLSQVINRTAEMTTNAFTWLGEASNLNQVVSRTAEMTTSAFSTVADTIDVYINAGSEFVTNTFEWAGEVSSAITAVVTGAFGWGAEVAATATTSTRQYITSTLEWGAEIGGSVSNLIQRIATMTLEWGAIFLGTASGVVPLVEEATELVRRGTAFVRRGVSFVGGSIKDMLRRYNGD